jgi:cytidylate kinase
LTAGNRPAASRVFSGVIALDGPSGTGKSTVARGLARRLGIDYLDTGAMYRAATLAVLADHVDLSDEAAIAASVATHRIGIRTDPVSSEVTLDDVAVERKIRGVDVTAAVSAISAVAAVRERLVAQQRALIAAGPMVAEGRDIASVVWPQAELQVYLTASEAVRARRRSAQLPGHEEQRVAADLRRRDEFDSSRAVSPLTRTDAAVEVDTSDLSVDEVITVLAELARQSMTGAGPVAE